MKCKPRKVALISTEPVTTQQKLKYDTKLKMIKCKMIQKKPTLLIYIKAKTIQPKADEKQTLPGLESNMIFKPR